MNSSVAGPGGMAMTVAASVGVVAVVGGSLELAGVAAAGAGGAGVMRM